MTLQKRKRCRLPRYDYSSSGAYFITICAAEKRHIFGEICVGQGLAPAETKLSICGKVVDMQIKQIPERFKNVEIDNYVVMPNHVHILMKLLPAPAGASPCPTIPDVVCALKSLTVRQCRMEKITGRIFQNSFHDHIIRNERDYQRIWQYIDTNPAKWQEDCYYEA